MGRKVYTQEFKDAVAKEALETSIDSAAKNNGVSLASADRWSKAYNQTGGTTGVTTTNVGTDLFTVSKTFVAIMGSNLPKTVKRDLVMRLI